MLLHSYFATRQAPQCGVVFASYYYYYYYYYKQVPHHIVVLDVQTSSNFFVILYHLVYLHQFACFLTFDPYVYMHTTIVVV